MEPHLALIGFGEAASTFAGAARWGRRVKAFDIDLARLSAMRKYDVTACSNAHEALADANIVFSLVTADMAFNAARDYAQHIEQGTIWCDMNSVAPQTKCDAAQQIETLGGRYVDAAILAPVDPAQMNAPILLSGAAADAARTNLLALGFTNVRVIGEEIGKASAIKMIRSLMVKGVEALTGEMMQAGHAAGVTEEVLASLDASQNDECWNVRAAYNLERMATHGARRAAEMEEVAKTLVAFGVEPLMTKATVRRQREAAAAKPDPKDAM